ncbi:hypothetical protein EVB55_248 [Rhizobium phage RHph_Y68]|uniref:Uncharacterized protein n=1 Tax=Rhizobium phage RHph_Y68 TaxID=2509787 RepID=A0A7S5UUJ6_9CAUD|nr:hypothetical protein PP934_gp248 [Rhizobium phage RHph_Y68]QIG68183.1 hypothetical protein EVB55_248 [Rhizobium phage RHph_Y68]
MTKFNEVYRDRRTGHFKVKVMFRPPMEDMFETIEFAGRFENVIDANRFLERVNAKIRTLKCFQCAYEALDLTRWTWVPTKASPCGFLHDAPTAVPFVIPTSDYAKNLVNNSN